MKNYLSRLALLLMAALLEMSATAGTNGMVVPTIRSLPGSSFAGWEVFSNALNTNNVPDLAGSTSAARLWQTDTNAFVTGSGNIYNPAGTNSFVVSFASRTPVSQVAFQVRSLGAEIDYSSVKIRFDGSNGIESISPTRTELDRGTTLGVNVTSKWDADLSGRDVTVFNIEFAAAGSSLSFDSATLDVAKETIHVTQSRVDMDRWMYPNNATPGARVSASVFSVFGENGDGLDTRWAQFLFGWNTGSTGSITSIPTGLGAENYIVQKASVNLTINRNLAWVYDGTYDPLATYLTTNDVRHAEDSDPGRPVELFGAGFRGGFDFKSFLETGPFGADGVGARNAYAAGFNASGELVDISSNVGKEDTAAFETIPFAVGVAPDLTAGDLVPTGTRLTFNLDVGNADVASYLQSGLDVGALRFTTTALVDASFSSPNYPQFYTRDNTLATSNEVPLIDLDVQIAKPSPTLRFSSNGDGKLRFAWPASAERYEVETTSSTAPNAIWLRVPGEVQPGDATNFFETDIPAEAAGVAIFRLHRVL